MRRRSFLLAATGTCLMQAAHAEEGVTDKEVLFGQTAMLSGAVGVAVKARTAGAELPLRRPANKVASSVAACAWCRSTTN